MTDLRAGAQQALDDDDAQGYIADYEAALKIAYEIGFENGKKAQPEQQAEPFSAVSIHATQTAWKMGYEAAKAEMQPAQAAAELRRLHESNQELLAALKACADTIQTEIWNSGDDECENHITKYWVQLVKKARAAIAKGEAK